MDNMLDYIVVGGGIAGLYANYKLSHDLKRKGILLEKENDLGGRALEVNFHGRLIKLGAGVMCDENKHLMTLLNKLKIKPNYFDSGKHSMLGYQFDMNQAIKQIIKKYNEEKDNLGDLTTEQFIRKYFGKSFTDKFIENCEYRDFLKSDPGYFIKYYDIHDMSHDSETISIIQWIDLINKLKMNNCMTGMEVKKISQLDKHYQVTTDKSTYNAKKIYLALTLKPLDKLVKNLINFKYSDFIGTVPFVRIYTWHKKPYDQSKLHHYNLVPNELQKIIKIDDNILMASYSDNTEAKYWKTILDKNKKILIKKVENKFGEINLGINKVDDVESIYWEEGVHYYKPYPDTTLNKLITKLAKPTKNIYVIGEIVSKKHGWVEGCIESVDRVIKS